LTATGTRRVLQRQVRRLVLFVVGVADEHRAQAVEGDLAVGLGVVDLRALGGRPQRELVVGAVCGAVVQGGL
jgi:hypothetical protein